MVRKRQKSVAVLTADIIGSTSFDSVQRRKIDQIIRRSFAETLRRFPDSFHTPFAFRITAGDEFQCVIRDIPKAFDILTYLRACAATKEVYVYFRASIGVGEIMVTRKSNPYEEDGPAFARSRRGLEELAKSKHRLTKIIVGQLELDRLLDIVLLLLDRLQEKWTVPQWEAIKWSLLGLSATRISKKIVVAHQNVTKRLRAAGWKQFKEASELLREILSKTA